MGLRQRVTARNLVLVTHRYLQDRESFQRMAARVQEIAPDVRPHVLEDAPGGARLARLALRPTLVFSPIPLGRLRPWRGRVRQGRYLGKVAELRALERHGLPVPRWTVLTPGREPDLSGFDEYAVVKPDQSARGVAVRIQRLSRLHWKPPPRTTPVSSDRWVVQRFIHTGPWPVSYRVTTLFGETLFAIRSEASHQHPRLESPDGFRRGGIGVVASGRGARMELTDEPDVLALGERAHGAFPRRPLLGVDVVREQATGKLFVLEVNSSGYTWHFTTRTGRAIQVSQGLDLEKQFDGIRKAARVLADRTRRLAR